MITHNIKLDMFPGAVPAVVYLSQYDDDFTLNFQLYSSRGTFTTQSGTTAEIRGTKADGNGYSVDATISGNTVTVAGDKQMTACAGWQTFELTLFKGSKELNTSNFILAIERAALDADTITSESKIKELVDVLQQADEIMEAAETVEEAIDVVQADFSKIEDAMSEDVQWEIGSTGYAQPYGSGALQTNSIFNTTKYVDISGYKYIKYLAACSSASTTYIGMAFFSGKTVGSYISGVSAYARDTSGMREQRAEVPEGALYARFTVRADWEDRFFIKGFRSLTETIERVEESGTELRNKTNISLLSFNEVDVSDVFATTTYPTGWRTGRYNDSGSITSDDTSICTAVRLGIPGSKRQRLNAKGVRVSCPFGTIEVKEFNNGALTNTVTGTGEVWTTVVDGDLVSVSIYGLTSPSQSYIDNEDINEIKIYTLFPEWQKEGSNVSEEYFKVPINSTWTGEEEDTVNTVEVDCVVRFPSTYTPIGKATRLIFMHHGNSGTVNADEGTWYSEASNWNKFVNGYLNAGYAVFDVNGCGPVSDPNASHDYAAFGALAAAYAAYRYIYNKYNVQERILVHGSSMGGATAYAFAKTFGGIVDALGLFSPALLSRSVQLSETTEGYIAVNYGYEDAEEMVADNYSHLIPSNPKIQYYHDGVKVEKPFTYDWVNNHESDDLEIVCADFPCPVKIWCGSADTAVDVRYGEALAKAITNNGKLAVYRLVEGATHSACVGGSTTFINEGVMWFNRFSN